MCKALDDMVKEGERRGERGGGYVWGKAASPS